MKTQTKISALQFYLMLFLSRAVISLTVNSQTVGEVNFLDNILSSVLLLAALFICAVPLFSLHRIHPEESLPAIAEERLGKGGYAVSFFYSLYFLIMNTYSLALYLTLLMNTMDPAASKWSIALVLTGIALYGAIKGIETVSRASICIAVLFFLGFIILFIALIPHMNKNYTEPLLYDGAGQMLQGVYVFAARCTSIAELAVLMPFVQSGLRRGFAVWNVGAAVFVSVLLIFLIVCLGEYSYLQIFPVYTLATMAEIAGIQRLDALLAGLGMMALVIRTACGLFGISECWARAVRPRARMWLLCAAAGIGAFGALWITGSVERNGWIFRVDWLLPLTVLTGAVLPVFIWLTDRMRRRRTER